MAHWGGCRAREKKTVYWLINQTQTHDFTSSCWHIRLTVEHIWTEQGHNYLYSFTVHVAITHVKKPTHALLLTLILLMWNIGWAPNSISIYIQQDATLHSLFISGNCSTCFGWYFHPSSGTHTTVSKASGICHTVTAICRKYHPKHVEQFPDINKLCNFASCWIYTYIGIYLRCTDP
jgi:hypothetical protein